MSSFRFDSVLTTTALCSLISLLAGCNPDPEPMTSETGSETATETGDGDGDGEPDPVCGNGVVESGEECDDANTIDTDACTSICVLPTCGDGFVQEDVEVCDDGNMDNTDACAECADAVCGDGFVQQDIEDCDDGNTSDTDDCTNTCEAASCGDGFVQPGEDCDDQNGDNTDACVDCLAATCGDGFIEQGVEQCDDGNMVDDDGCDNACMGVVCGNGFLQEGEECDDGNILSLDGCYNCAWENRLAFATSSTYTGDLGGLAGADAICNQVAADAGLPGTYMAWLSAGADSPSTRFVQSAVPYVLPDGNKVADDWADLIDGSLDFAVARTETGAPSIDTVAMCANSVRLARTGTTESGTPAPSTCVDFTSSLVDDLGTIGRTTATMSGWSACGEVGCDVPLPIYCFQQ